MDDNNNTDVQNATSCRGTTIEDRARKATVYSRHVTHIEYDVARCWRKVGAILRVRTPALRNINEDEKSSQDKAWEVLNIWKQQEGENATVGTLVDNLEKIQKKDIAHKLLEFAVKEEQEEENKKLQKGNQTCPRCSILENDLNDLRTEMESKINQLELNQNGERQTSKKEKNKMEEEIKKCKTEIEELKKANEQERRERSEIEEKRKEDNRKSAKLIREEMDKRRGLEQEKRKLEEEKENLQNEKSDLESSVKKKNRECDKLVEEARQASTEIYRLQQEANEKQAMCKTLEEKIIKCKNFVSRTFLPSEEDFHKPGVIRTLRRDESAELIATRSSEGPGDANDVLNHESYKRRESCGTAEIEKSWWCVDLSEDYLLFLTHYSLRHGKKGGDSALLHWKLQGSIDGEDWKEIKTEERKRNDKPKFKDPHPYFTGTWAVEDKVGAFRYFKIVQTGKNDSHKYGMYLYGIEFYGVLIKAERDEQNSEP